MTVEQARAAMTWREFLDWLAFLDWEAEHGPDALYQAQIAAEIRRSYVTRPGAVRLGDFVLRRAAPAPPEESKSVWLRWAGIETADNGRGQR